MMSKTILSLSLVLSSLLILLCDTEASDSGLKVTTFSVEITPELGQPVGLGFIPILKTAEHPLLARGIILRDSGMTCVIATLDWMEVHNESYDFLRQAIAKAAGTNESLVALHSLHQHTGPAISKGSQKLDLRGDDPRRVASQDYLADVAKKLSRVIKESQRNWQTVSSVSTGKAKVERVASSRRLLKTDGSIQGRGSNIKNKPELRELSEGLIDPWVRTVSLDGEGGPVVQLHYYASHPQTFYGDGRASYDIPGMLRERLQKKTGTFQLYVTGCGGDIAFGKYNNGSREARAELASRLQAGIEKSIASLVSQPIEKMTWSVEPMTFPLRTDDAFTETTQRKILDDSESRVAQRRKAAIALAWIERVNAGKPVELSCLSIGKVKMLHLPGEPFVQYQLAAQLMRPDRFVCVAGYGDCGMGYIGGDKIFTDRGGYEQTYAFAGPCEELFLSKIRKLLKAKSGEKN